VHVLDTAFAHRSLAQTLQAAGEPVVLGDRCCWRPAGRFSLQSFPGALAVNPSPQELRDVLMRSGRLVALTCSSVVTAQLQFRYVARREGHGPARQQRQFRQTLRSGGRFCSVGPIAWPDLEREGSRVNRVAVAGGRSSHQSWCRPEHWRRFCRALACDPQMEAWGCRVDGQLAAFLLLWMETRTAHGFALQWDPALAWAHPTHCLYDGALNALFARGTIDAVMVGRQTIPARPDLNRFKRHAGFAAEPCSLKLAAHPWLAPVLRGHGSASVLRRLARAGSSTWPLLNQLEVLAKVCEQAAR
jgi:hypothetical protein